MLIHSAPHCRYEKKEGKKSRWYHYIKVRPGCPSGTVLRGGFAHGRPPVVLLCTLLLAIVCESHDLQACAPVLNSQFLIPSMP